jgi:hypothetical protein
MDLRNRGKYPVEVEQEFFRVHDLLSRKASAADVRAGATRCADGGVIAHGLGRKPTVILVTGTVSGEFVSVPIANITATTFTVAIKTHANGAGTTQTVFWRAEVL